MEAPTITIEGVIYTALPVFKYQVYRWRKLPFLHCRELVQKWEAVSGDYVWIKVQEEEVED